jgi:NDP-sugar pyrophosphorylase family protein
MILAAGLGTRLRPITNTVPKPLLPVAGLPLIIWNLLMLRHAEVLEVIINLHHLGHLIEKELGNGARFGMRISYSREPVILGTGGGIKQAASFFGNDPFLVVNGDTLLELNLARLIDEHGGHARQQPDLIATLVVRRDPDVERWGPVELVGDRIVRINGRGRLDPGKTEKRMFAGVHVLHPRILDRLPQGQACSIIDAYVEALATGETLCGYDFNGYWSDVGTAERYQTVMQDAEQGVIDLKGRLRSGEWF